ncbi:MAG: histidine kinase dimerization/phosphoacceptor domain -containing protein [Campylobacterota bacterium]
MLYLSKANYFLTVLFFLLLLLHTTASAVEIGDQAVIDNFELAYFYDESNTMHIEDVVGKAVFTPINNTINTGPKFDIFWFKVTFSNMKNNIQTRILACSETYASGYDFYEYSSDNRFLKSFSSRNDPNADERVLEDPYPAYKIVLAPHETKIVYLKVRSGFGILNRMTIHKPTHYFRTNTYQNYFFIFYFGILFSSISFSLLLFIYNREPIYVYYSLYLAVYNVWVLLQSGFVEFPFFQLGFAAVPIAFIFFMSFTRELMRKEIKFPLFNTVLNTYTFLFILGVIILIIDFPLYILYSTLVIFSLFFLGVTIIRYGAKHLHLYSYALMIFLVSLSLPPLMYHELLPYNFITRNGNALGSTIEMILFSILLANRIKVLKQEKLHINEEIVTLKTKQNELLQTKVQEQTKELKLLFQELHHRVKNNFQFILTFLWIQKKSIHDKKAVEAFDVTTNRIFAMSQLHELLYKTDNPRVNMRMYVKEFLQPFQENNPDITIESNIVETDLTFDTAVTFGLILNELITNSTKYAFEGIADPRIYIDFNIKDGQHLFVYRDNGVGFDEKILRTSAGLGYELIREFIHKLENSTMVLNTANGVEITITFTCENYYV